MGRMKYAYIVISYFAFEVVSGTQVHVGLSLSQENPCAVGYLCYLWVLGLNWVENYVAHPGVGFNNSI